MKAMYFLQKKSILFLSFSLLLASVYAGPVGKEKAKLVAQKFLSYKQKSNLSNSFTTYEAIMDKANNGQCVMHVFKGDNSYIVVAADDRIYPILAYSDESSFPAKGKVPALDSWMDNLAKSISSESYLKSSVKQEVVSAWDLYLSNAKTSLNLKSTNSVGPLLTTRWDQSPRYNYYCPVYTTTSTGKCVTGCVATSMAQVMKFYNYPSQGRGSYSYSHPAFGVLSANFNTTYDWANMVDNLSQVIITDTVPRNAIAKLMYHCGVAVEMDYGPIESGSQTEYAPYALYTYFKYRRYINYLSRSDYPDDQWRNILIENLDMHYPIIYSGRTATDGHAWVCDGYGRDTATYFHFNWGWSGQGNGNFYLNNLNSGNGLFDRGHGVVINIVPDLDTYHLCGIKTYTAQNYTFTDGSYSDDYSNNTDCRWLIKPDTMGTDTLRLSFLEFRTYDKNDSLTVYDGETTSAPIFHTYSGNLMDSLPTLLSTSGAFLLVFKTNAVNTDLGWKVKYTTKTDILGIQENEIASQLNVYPNPAHNQLNISGNFKFTGNAKYSVSNILGEKVLSSEMNISGGIQNKTIDISQLKAGIYILNIKNEKANFNTKFIVE